MSNAFSGNERCNWVADEKHVQHAEQSDEAEDGTHLSRFQVRVLNKIPVPGLTLAPNVN